jgi:hypothetical protein
MLAMLTKIDYFPSVEIFYKFCSKGFRLSSSSPLTAFEISIFVNRPTKVARNTLLGRVNLTRDYFISLDVNPWGYTTDFGSIIHC